MHPKVQLLAAALGIERYAAVGVLECLYHFTAYYAPRGDVGKYGDAAIAGAIGWSGDPTDLVETLVRCRLVDHDPTHRLVVHDWHEHADDSTKRTLTRSGQWFVKARKKIQKTSSTKGGQCPASPPEDAARQGIGKASSSGHEVKGESEGKTKSPDPLDGFAQWYEPYPRKEARADAEKAWRQMARERPPLATMLHTLAWQKAIWATKDRTFTPLPASYLRGARWADEPPPGTRMPSVVDAKPLSEIKVHPLAARLNAMGREKAHG